MSTALLARRVRRATRLLAFCFSVFACIILFPTALTASTVSHCKVYAGGQWVNVVTVNLDSPDVRITPL